MIWYFAYKIPKYLHNTLRKILGVTSEVTTHASHCYPDLIKASVRKQGWELSNNVWHRFETMFLGFVVAAFGIQFALFSWSRRLITFSFCHPSWDLPMCQQKEQQQPHPGHDSVFILTLRDKKVHSRFLNSLYYVVDYFFPKKNVFIDMYKVFLHMHSVFLIYTWFLHVW